MLELAGQLTPLVTPFTDDGVALSEVRLSRLIRFYLGQRAEGFAICTDIGEFPTLAPSERKQLLEWVMRESHGAYPITTNVSTLSTSLSLDLAQHAQRHGARAVTVMPPFYGTPTQHECVEHIRVVSAYSKLPLIVVDAFQILEEDARRAITHFPNVHLAWNSPDAPMMATDWFRCYGLVVEPMTAVPDSVASDFLQRNRAAVTKTLLADFDIESGTPRMPVQPVPYREIRQAA